MQWHQNSLQHLKSCDLIFYDPDNGLEVQSRGKLHPKSFKYVYFDEVFEAFKQEKSVVIYQHTNQNVEKDQQIENKVLQLKDSLSSLQLDTKIDVVSGKRRFFIIVKNEKHLYKLDNNIKHVYNSLSPANFKIINR